MAKNRRMWASRAGLASAVVLFFRPVAWAATVQTFSFENDYFEKVTCVVSTAGGQERHSVITDYANGQRRELGVGTAKWASSGCKAFVAEQTRPMSQAEFRRRLRAHQEAVEHPPSFAELLAEARRQWCSDAEHSADEQCK